MQENREELVYTQSSSKMKTVALVALMILVTGATMLIDFVQAQFSTSIFTNPSYWLNMLSMQSAVIILLFVERTISKEKERKENGMFKDLVASLMSAFRTLNAENLNSAFKAYIAADNRRRKLEAYINVLGAKKARHDDKAARIGMRIRRIEFRAKDKGRPARGIVYAILQAAKKRQEDKSAFWQMKIDRAPEEVDFVRRVKFVRWSYDVIFADYKARQQDEEDPAVHEGRDIAFILMTKGLSIVAFGLIATSYLTFDFTFDVAMIYRTIIKVVQIVLGLYTGAVSGQYFIRTKMCAKLMTRFNYVKQFKEQVPTQKEAPASV